MLGEEMDFDKLKIGDMVDAKWNKEGIWTATQTYRIHVYIWPETFQTAFINIKENLKTPHTRKVARVMLFVIMWDYYCVVKAVFLDIENQNI